VKNQAKLTVSKVLLSANQTLANKKNKK